MSEGVDPRQTLEDFEEDDGPPDTPNPEIRDAIGEDPARFLGRDVVASSDVDVTMCRIRGIRDPDVLTEWIKIEGEVFQRPGVLGALNRRKAELDGLEPYDDVLEQGRERFEQRRREREEDVDEDEPAVYRDRECGSTDVEAVSSMAFHCPECDVRISAASDRVEVVEP